MTEKHSSSGPAEVVIAGGGVAALEALMALRELASAIACTSRSSPRTPTSFTEP